MLGGTGNVNSLQIFPYNSKEIPSQMPTGHTANFYNIEGYAIKILNFTKWSWNEVFIIKKLGVIE
mgnify:CR=1 FL=1